MKQLRFRYLFAIVVVMLSLSTVHAATITPAFGKWSSATGSVDAGKQNINTMKVDGATFTKPGGKPSMLIHGADVVDARVYPSLAAADTAASSAGKLLVVSTQWDTVPATLAANVKVLPGGKFNNSGSLQITGSFDAGLYQVFMGSGAVTGLKVARPEWWGAAVGNVVESAVAIQASWAASKHIVYDLGTYKVSTTLQISSGGYLHEGQADGDRQGTIFNFYGSGPCIQNGTDNGHSWDVNEYDGPQGHEFRNMRFMAQSSATALANGKGNYLAGSYGFRDWRGGGLVFKSCGWEHFEYTFWGVQSDVNVFDTCESYYSKYGYYLGPRSDQQTFIAPYSFYCDTMATIDGARSVRFYHLISAMNGSPSTYPIDIKQGAGPVTFDDPWFEWFDASLSIDAWVAIGVNAGYASGNPTGNTASAKGVAINHPFIYTDVPGDPKSKYLVRIGKAVETVVKYPSTTATAGLSVLDALIEFNSTAHTGVDAQCHYVGNNSVSESKIYLNNGTGTPSATYEVANSANEQTFGTITNLAKVHLKALGASTGADDIYFTQQNTPGALQAYAPNYTGGQTLRLNLRKSWQAAFAMPTTGTWEAGDIVWNLGLTPLGTSPNQYILLGWARKTNGSAHVLDTDWFEMRAGTTESMDHNSGTYTPTVAASVNLTVTAGLKSQWLRVGNIVTVSGAVTGTPTANSAATSLEISLPIASDFTAVSDCAGSARSTTIEAAAIRGEITDNKALLVGTSSAASAGVAQTYYFTFSYEVK